MFVFVLGRKSGSSKIVQMRKCNHFQILISHLPYYPSFCSVYHPHAPRFFSFLLEHGCPFGCGFNSFEQNCLSSLVLSSDLLGISPSSGDTLHDRLCSWSSKRMGVRQCNQIENFWLIVSWQSRIVQTFCFSHCLGQINTIRF